MRHTPAVTERGCQSRKSDTDIEWGTRGLDNRDTSALDRERLRMLHGTAFLGDLYAVGILKTLDMTNAINLLVQVVWRSTLQVRALCLLLSRVVYNAGERLDPQFLIMCRMTVYHKLCPVEDEWATRWRMVRPIYLYATSDPDGCVIANLGLPGHDSGPERPGPTLPMHESGR